MAEDRNSMATPRLRFPEFRESGEWKTERMEKLYSFMRNNALSRDKLNYDSGTVKNIHYGDIHTKFSALFDINKERVPYINSTEELPEVASEDYCAEGDIIFADASEDMDDVGKSIEIVRLNSERLLSGQHTILAHRKDNTLIVGFGGHLFRSWMIRSQIQKEAQGTKVYAISSTRLANIEIAYPCDETEQQKIADCLTSLDEVITAQRRKVEALKAHKRGLMQQLFPRDGEILPRRRFSEFANEGSWHTQKISSLLSKATVPVIVSPEEMYREIGIRSHGKGVFHKEPVRGKVIGTKRVFRVVEKAFTVNIVFAWEQAVATTSKAEEGMIASHRFPMYVVKSGKCDVRYVKEFFLTKRGKHLLGLASPGGAGRNKTLGQKEFENLEIALPEMVDEQTRIADCLSFIDAQIVAESEKLGALKTHKAGLMQHLFPSD
jgi:type I restriction enzyme, S subunit